MFSLHSPCLFHLLRVQNVYNKVDIWKAMNLKLEIQIKSKAHSEGNMQNYALRIFVSDVVIFYHFSHVFMDLKLQL